MAHDLRHQSVILKKHQLDIFSGVSRTEMTVSLACQTAVLEFTVDTSLLVGELLEKSTRALTPEERLIFDTDWTGKDGSKRKLEVCLSLFSHRVHILNHSQLIMGRQKLKKSFQYEIKWRGLDHKYNTWVARDDLLAKGFSKVVQQFDDLESSRDGAGSRDTSAHLVRKHLEQIGLDGDIAQYNAISGLSGGIC